MCYCARGIGSLGIVELRVSGGFLGLFLSSIGGHIQPGFRASEGLVFVKDNRGVRVLQVGDNKRPTDTSTQPWPQLPVGPPIVK